MAGIDWLPHHQCGQVLPRKTSRSLPRSAVQRYLGGEIAVLKDASILALGTIATSGAARAGVQA